MIQVFDSPTSLHCLTSIGLCTALSPNSCCAAVMYADGKVKLKKMEYTSGDILQIVEDEREYNSSSWFKDFI
jgi:hypothetical protein